MINWEIVWISFLLLSAVDPSWATLSIDDPPPASDDNDEFTYIKDASGNINKVAVDLAPNDPVPYFAAKTDTRFELFTLKNPTEPQLLFLDNSTTIDRSNFNSAYPTRMFVHGW